MELFDMCLTCDCAHWVIGMLMIRIKLYKRSKGDLKTVTETELYF